MDTFEDYAEWVYSENKETHHDDARDVLEAWRKDRKNAQFEKEAMQSVIDALNKRLAQFESSMDDIVTAIIKVKSL